MANIPDPLSISQLNAEKINTNELNVTSIGGGGGSGAVITASKIILTSSAGNWILAAKGDGLYITTPDNIETKMELIDLRKVPIPPTVDLLNVVGTKPVLLPISGGPDTTNSLNPQNTAEGAGNSIGGGGVQGSTAINPGSPYTTTPAGTILPGGDGVGYQPISDAAKAKLPSDLQNDTAFLNCLDSLAQSKNVPADSLLAVMQIESGINPQAKNNYSGAVGLNQIMPSTAQGLGYTTDQISGMTASQQMCGPTTAYFNSVSLPASPTTADLYLANFYPAAVGQSDDFVLGNNPGLTPQLVAQQNPIFKNQDGVVTVGSIKQYLTTRSQ